MRTQALPRPPVYTARDGRVIIIGLDGIHWWVTGDPADPNTKWVPVLVPLHHSDEPTPAAGPTVQAILTRQPAPAAGPVGGGQAMGTTATRMLLAPQANVVLDGQAAELEPLDEPAPGELSGGVLGWLPWLLAAIAVVLLLMAGSG